MAGAIQSINVSSGAVTALSLRTLVAGAGITLTTDAANLTIAATAAGLTVTDTATVDLSYVAPNLQAAVRTQQSLTSDANGVKLQGDVAAPGSSKYYGTDGAGARGYFALPVSTSEGQWRFNVSTAAADPGTARLSFNSATPASVTAVYLSKTTDGGADVAQFLRGRRADDTLYVQDKDNSANWMRFLITAVPADNAAWFSVPVSYVSHAGALPSNNALLAAVFGTSGGGAGGAGGRLVYDYNASFTAGTAPATYNITSSAGNVTATLPAAAGNAGLRLCFRRTNASSGANFAAISTGGGEMIHRAESSATTLYLYHQHDSVELESDGTGWSVVADGRRAFVCSARRAAAQSVPHTANVKLLLDAADADEAGMFNLAGGDVTVRRTGRYLVRAYCYFVGTNVQAYIYLNGAQKEGAAITNTSGTGGMGCTCVALLPLTAGDVLSMYVYHSGSGTAQNTGAAFNTTSRFSVNEVR